MRELLHGILTVGVTSLSQSALSPQPLELTNEWDRVATTQWGAYVSEIERRAILFAHDLVRVPAVGLDLGCGAGRWSRMLADRGWQMICTDVNAEALEICKGRVPAANCILRGVEEKSLPCEANSISLILCIEVPPVMQSDWFISEAARVVRPGGAMVVVSWNRLSLRGLFCHARSMFGWDFDFYRLKYSAWKQNALAAGFQTVTEEGFCWFPMRRNSDSGLVRYAISLEKTLGLRRMIAVSPWIVSILQKARA